MHQNDAISRSDGVLIAALTIVLITASAAFGSALTYHPDTSSFSFHAPAATPHLAAATAARLVEDQAMNALIAEHRCLTEALYYEARGEGRSGEQAVAEVVFHRLNTGAHGHSLCEVVYEGAGHPGCQFSFACDGSRLHLREEAAWKDAEQLAEEILTGAVQLRNATGGATNYHATTVSPYWAPTLRETAQIGNHIFYRGPSGDYRLVKSDQTP
jgi:spore germination cell wall hydrolase CwlJ-like protein